MGKFKFGMTRELWLDALAGWMQLPDGVKIVEIVPDYPSDSMMIYAEADNMGVGEGEYIPTIAPLYERDFDNNTYHFVEWHEFSKSQ